LDSIERLTMSKKLELHDLDPLQRREFLGLASGFLSLPFLSTSMVEKCWDVLIPQAHAQMTGPKFFLEVNFRDQWDFGHVFLPPSIARRADELRSSQSLAYFNQQGELTQGPNNFWITPQGRPLIPHLNDIAVMELGEACIGGVHAHEAGNGMRSPGRSYNQRPGTMDMATVDKRPGNRSAGNEVLYSSTPTPAVLHNSYVKSMGYQNNGVLYRSSIRQNIHTFYHFEGSLQNAQLDRYFDKQSFLNSIGNSQVPLPGASVMERYGDRLAELIKFVDGNYFRRKPSLSGQQSNHETLVNDWSQQVQAQRQSLDINLDAQTIAAWTQGVPSQKTCPGDQANNCREYPGKTNLGEIFAWTSRLFAGNRVKTMAVDFDFHDVHGNRNQFVLETQAHSTALPLARLIESLKASGIWDQTVIAMYTLDGSRGPNRSSTGYRTKNALILAGGGVRGGYYGDIDYQNGWLWKRPDNNGRPVAGTTDGLQGRVPDADVYKTVARAAGIADSVVNGFPDAAPGRVLNYMLKS
jgi:hypothetical protein